MSTQATQLNPLDAATGMRLAFWAYPHKDIEAAERVAKYPNQWKHAAPGDELPSGFRSYAPAQNGQPAQEGWNTQHDAQGKLTNQFMVSINMETKQVTFDFKGSDNASNFKSDFANAGASEFGRIQGQAQQALEALKNSPDYKGFSYAATGHSLGGGMAQSFALKNNLDAYVYNSLPIARDTVQGDYFKSAGGFDAAVETYKNSGRTVHDIRTPNDIATATYDTVMRNQYLSDAVPPGAQQLPGAAIPDVLKLALLSNQATAVPALAIMANDHRMGAMFDAQYGLGMNTSTGAYRIPEGHVDFAAIPANVRQEFARLSTSPVTKVYQSERGETHDSAISAYDRFELSREDGSRQHLGIHKASGDIELDHRHSDGRRTEVTWNPQQNASLHVEKFDAQGQRLEAGQASAPEAQALKSGPPNSQTVMATATATAKALAPPGANHHGLDPEAQAKLQQVQSQLSPALAAKGFSSQQIELLSAATLAHLEQHESKGGAERILVAKDGSSIAVDHGNSLLSEMQVAPALRKDTAEHLHGFHHQHASDTPNMGHQSPQPPAQSMAPLQR